MRRWFYGLVLAVGLLAAVPTPSRAQFLPPYITSGYRVGPYGYMSVVGTPMYRWQVTPFGYREALYYPGAYNTAFNPLGGMQSWTGPALAWRSYTPWTGWSSQVSTSWQAGYTFNPYSGFQAFAYPGLTTSTSLNGGFVWLSPNYRGANSTFATLANATAMNNNLALAMSVGNVFGNAILAPNWNFDLLTRTLSASIYNGYVPANYIIP